MHLPQCINKYSWSTVLSIVLSHRVLLRFYFFWCFFGKGGIVIFNSIKRILSFGYLQLLYLQLGIKPPLEVH